MLANTIESTQLLCNLDQQSDKLPDRWLATSIL